MTTQRDKDWVEIHPIAAASGFFIIVDIILFLVFGFNIALIAAIFFFCIITIGGPEYLKEQREGQEQHEIVKF